MRKIPIGTVPCWLSPWVGAESQDHPEIILACTGMPVVAPEQCPFNGHERTRKLYGNPRGLLIVARPEIAPRSPGRSSCVDNVGWPVEQLRKPRQYAPQVGTHLKRSLTSRPAAVNTKTSPSFAPRPFISASNHAQNADGRCEVVTAMARNACSTSAQQPDVRLQYVEHATLAKIFRVSFRVPRGGEHAA